MFYLYPRPPYDFSLSAAIFAGGDSQIRIYEDNRFSQALDIGGNPVLIEVISEGSADSPKLRLTLRPESAFSKGRMKEVKNLVSSMFNISEDITPFYEAMERDMIMAGLTRS